MDSLLSSNTLIRLRLYLIRHGETEANRQGLVVGNAESPLTALGIDQAQKLGRTSSWLRNQKHFHRIFSSDLERAKRTTMLVLSELQSAAVTATTCSTLSSGGGTDTPEAFDDLLQSVEYTPELRELAKGPRQGFPKTYTIDEAIEKRQQLSITEPFPLLESDEDGWDRISHWFCRQIRIAIDQTRADCTTTSHHTFHILVFGHAGIFRIFLTRLIGQPVLMAHPSAKLDSYGQLSVPNTSLTILDIHLDASLSLDDDDDDDVLTPENRIRNIDVILLTSTEHIPVQTK